MAANMSLPFIVSRKLLAIARLNAIWIALSLGSALCPKSADAENSPKTSTSAETSHAPSRLPPGQVDGQRILAEADSGGNWLTYGRTYDEQRFSPLKEINDRNVSDLGLAWHADIASPDGLAATPLVVDGVIYLSGGMGLVVALNAGTGKEIWSFRPNRLNLTKFMSSWSSRVNRGVAVWKGKVYLATGDCRLIAINAATGKEAWEVANCDVEQNYGSSGAPRIAKDMVLIGNAGADFGARGYVSAYDASNGKLKWRFFVVPGNPAQGFEQPALREAAKTWSGKEWWKSGGGSAWDAIVYDPELNQVYFGTDASSPWDGKLGGRGDALFTESVVAVDADTGQYRWHYQETPDDVWDYNSTNPIVLADLSLSGQKRKVILHAPKNGFFYVLDRSTGKLISADKIATVTWASGVDPASGRPIETPNARYYKNKTSRAILFPNVDGAHGWQATSYSSLTGLIYLPIADTPTEYRSGVGKDLGAIEAIYLLPKPGEKPKPFGKLLAWDPVARTSRWSVDLKYAMNGGTLATAGNLVFQGTAEGEFDAYDAASGRKLWNYPIVSATQAAAVSYRVSGKQYVLLPVGAAGISRMEIPEYGNPPHARGPTRLLAFALGGKDQIPPGLAQAPLPIPKPPPQFGSPEMIERGRKLYGASICGTCHGMWMTVAAGGSVRDLRSLPQGLHDMWDQIVRGGAFQELGMPSFKATLSEEDARAIHAYVISREQELYEAQQKH